MPLNEADSNSFKQKLTKITCQRTYKNNLDNALNIKDMTDLIF